MTPPHLLPAPELERILAEATALSRAYIRAEREWTGRFFGLATEYDFELLDLLSPDVQIDP